MADIKRKASAIWQGKLESGNGVMSTQSGVLKDEKYSFKTRFENSPGTNPEELIAAAHAGCFSMALAFTLGSQGHSPDKIETEAVCHMTPVPQGGFEISKMHLQVKASVPGLEDAAFQKIVAEADQGCPVSNLLRSGLKIEIEASLT